MGVSTRRAAAAWWAQEQAPRWPHAMKQSTEGLVARILKAKEAAAKAALADAQQDVLHRHEAMAAAGSVVQRERDAAAALAATLLAGVDLAPWSAEADRRLNAARHAAAAAEAACEPPREALSTAVRTRLAFNTLLARQAHEGRRLASRKDPLQFLLALPSARLPER